MWICYFCNFYTRLETKSNDLSSYKKESTLVEPDKVQPTSKGKLNNKEMTLSEVKDGFLTKKKITELS